jgi:hypothetical protein
MAYGKQAAPQQQNMYGGPGPINGGYNQMGNVGMPAGYGGGYENQYGQQ